VDGKIYVFGGLNSSWEGLNRVEVYDPKIDSWTSLSNMPTARGALSTVEMNDLIYVLGGITSAVDPREPALKTVEVYDTKAETWSKQVDMPTGRSHFGATVFKEVIYTIGGTLAVPEDSSLSVVEIYNTSKNIWISANPMPTKRSAHTTSIIEGKIYAVGGINTGPDWPGLTTVEVFIIK